MKKGDSHLKLDTYIRHWIDSKPYGHQIRILTEHGLMTIDCKWSDRVRSTSGRVVNKNLKISKG